MLLLTTIYLSSLRTAAKINDKLRKIVSFSKMTQSFLSFYSVKLNLAYCNLIHTVKTYIYILYKINFYNKKQQIEAVLTFVLIIISLLTAL